MNKNIFDHLSFDNNDHNSRYDRADSDWDSFTRSKKNIKKRVNYSDVDWSDVRTRNSSADRKVRGYAYDNRDCGRYNIEYKNNRPYDHDEKKTKENYKKMRCLNIINGDSCTYGDKCLYAHSLDEQKVDGVRKTALDVILKRKDLSDIDLSTNKKLYSHLKCMSSICQKCKEGRCTGGYNCKHGACNSGCVICLEDMNKGTCNSKCGNIHLTDRGLVPYGVKITKPSNYKDNRVKPIIINDNFFKTLDDRNNDVYETDATPKYPPGLIIPPKLRNSNELDATTNLSDSDLDIESIDSTNDNNHQIEIIPKKVNAFDAIISNGISKTEDSGTESELESDPELDLEPESKDKIDILLSFLNKDYLLESNMSKQDKSDTTNGAELSNLMSAMDSSSDGISLSDSQDESDDITEILLMNNNVECLTKSIFETKIY